MDKEDEDFRKKISMLENRQTEELENKRKDLEQQVEKKLEQDIINKVEDELVKLEEAEKKAEEQRVIERLQKAVMELENEDEGEKMIRRRERKSKLKNIQVEPKVEDTGNEMAKTPSKSSEVSPDLPDSNLPASRTVLPSPKSLESVRIPLTPPTTPPITFESSIKTPRVENVSPPKPEEPIPLRAPSPNRERSPSDTPKAVKKALQPPNRNRSISDTKTSPTSLRKFPSGSESMEGETPPSSPEVSRNAKLRRRISSPSITRRSSFSVSQEYKPEKIEEIEIQPEMQKCPNCLRSFEVRKDTSFSMCQCGYIYQHARRNSKVLSRRPSK